MKDRVSGTPGRYKLVFEDSTLGTQHAVLQLDDSPVVEGTPLNTTTLLKSDVAQKAGYTNEATPSDIFEYLVNAVEHSDYVDLWPDKVPPTESNVKSYDSNSEGAPMYKRWGPFVSIRGVVTPVGKGQSALQVGKLPAACAPTKQVVKIIQCSWSRRAAMVIDTEGNIRVERVSDPTIDYNTGSSQFVENDWVTFDIIYMR